MDPLKEAFDKIKNEMGELRNELSKLRFEISQVNLELNKTKDISVTKTPTDRPTQSIDSDTKPNTQTNNPTQNMSLEGPKGQNILFSIGNNGVPTDKQTNKQTDIWVERGSNNTQAPKQIQNESAKGLEFDYANKIIESLDEVKTQIRRKFKQLTPQEWTVFSLLYSLEDQGISEITYKTLANHLKLSESSVRDYTNRLLIKGMPINKKRLNNKTILLSISNNLKKIAPLSTLMQLREL